MRYLVLELMLLVKKQVLLLDLRAECFQYDHPIYVEWNVSKHVILVQFILDICVLAVNIAFLCL